MMPHGFEPEELEEELDQDFEVERYELSEKPRYTFKVSRRTFIQVVSAGILITWAGGPVSAQRRGASAPNPSARFLFNENGSVTAYTGKVEVGQGSRTQIAMAVAEELGLSLENVRVVMADTDLVPNDGGTWGSRTTPSTIPAMRQAAAEARQALTKVAAQELNVSSSEIHWQDDTASSKQGKSISIAKLSENQDALSKAFTEVDAASAPLSDHKNWRVLGTSNPTTSARAIVTGRHRYPSDVTRPGMLYGKILRPPGYNSTLQSIDLSVLESNSELTSVRDGVFAGVAAATTFEAEQALERLADTAKWSTPTGPDSDELSGVLKQHVADGSGRRRSNEREQGDVSAALKQASTKIGANFHIPYIQHAPMEPRAAVAEWNDEKLTVWTGTQNPFGVRSELARAFGIPETHVRVHVPDTGGGFGGKHTGEAAIEAASLSKVADKPVRLQWTRAEEFTWAYARPAGVIEVRVGLDKNNTVTAWDFTNYNSGGSGLTTPYQFPNIKTAYKACDSPHREGSYRALASTANHFAREVMIDRIAGLAKTDPVQFRLDHLDSERQKDVLNAAAKAVHWSNRNRGSTTRSLGIACGTEKASYIATAVELDVDADKKRFKIRRVTCAYECGAIQNPKNLRSQVEGSIVMGLGGALTEQLRFNNGVLETIDFNTYEVPRFKDIPPIDIILLDRPDLPSVGAGETPIIALAPAIVNALESTGQISNNALPIKIV